MKLTFILLIPTSNTAQNKKYIKRYINAGPMVGAPQMREVTFWVQLRKKAKVQIQYWEVGNKKKRYSTAIAQTLPSRAYVVHLRGDCLQPGKVYEYQLLINNRKIKWPYPMRFQTPPLWYRRIKEAPNFRFALGSCAFINDGLYDYKGKPYGGDYQIFSHIYTHHPQFMLWLGDNVYFRESDWTSRTGMIYRYTHDRSIPELQPLLNCSGHIAIWDDHDFGPNDSSSDFI
ncbi:MAG: alkaline phosphatase family protein, partial [Bacteroidia bacterium]|nr:alkaline phosphatase family protein [Bacteroidia bacterium]